MTQPEPLLTPSEVAAALHVNPKTVARWAKSGKLSSIRTVGGHRRFRETEVRALMLRASPVEVAELQVGDRVNVDGAWLTVTGVEPLKDSEHGTRRVYAGRWSALFWAGERVFIAPRPNAEPAK